MAASTKRKSDKKGLGRGLNALLGDAPVADEPSASEPRPDEPRRELPIEFLKPNASQPRRIFDEASIEELANSIKARGLLQPILVRPLGDDKYEIVAGERRWRAAQLAALHSVPVVIREFDDQTTAEIALIENVQRVDLNPIEEARGYQRLVKEYGRTQEEIANAVGKARSHIANLIRLLKLPPQVIDAVYADDIAMGHARALLAADDPIKALKVVLDKGLSVRQTEALVRTQFSPDRKDGDEPKSDNAKSTSKKKAGGDADTRALERDLSAILGLEVSIEHNKSGAGSITIDYLSLDQLDDVCRRLMGSGV